MIADLPAYLELLRREGELREITARVDPRLEAAEIHRRVIAEGGPALLFRSIDGSPYPLATNLFGTARRIELAFGPRPERIVREAAGIPHTLLPPTVGRLWRHRSLLRDLSRIGLRRRSAVPTTEVIEQPPMLGRLPLLTTWPEDGGPFVTLPLVYTEHPESGVHNLGMYRLQRFDDGTTGFHCQIGKGAGHHLAAAGELRRKLPVNVTIGGPPALMLAAVAPLPENVPELLLASLVYGRRLELGRNPCGPLPLIGSAEFTLVGEVDPVERRPEGPFGDHYGYYSLTHDFPVFRCNAVLRRRNPVCTATVVGKPKQEDFFLGDYLQELLSPLFPLVMPGVVDLWSYGETGYHSLAAACVRERYRREALVSGFRILGEGQLALTKFLLLTDQRLDLRDFKLVLERVLERADFASDLFVFSNTSMDTLDYTGPKLNEGSKGMLVGVGDPIRRLPQSFDGDLPSGIEHVAVFSPGCLVVSAGGEFDWELPKRAAEHSAFNAWPLVVLADDARRAAASASEFLWTTFTRFEPARDIHSRGNSIRRNHIAYEAPIVIDARLKPGFPEELACDPDTKALVDRRWGEYFS